MRMQTGFFRGRLIVDSGWWVELRDLIDTEIFNCVSVQPLE